MQITGLGRLHNDGTYGFKAYSFTCRSYHVICDAVWEDIKLLCDEGIQYGTASVCLPQSYVKAAVEYVNGKIPICTVVGFPNGYPTTAVKCFEADDAIKNGADEIDMVINVGWLKDKKYNLVLEEIKAIKNICGEKILKVIVRQASEPRRKDCNM